MTPRGSSVWLCGAFAAGLLAVGIPYWQVPYAKLSLPSGLLHPGLLVVVAAAMIACAAGRCRFMPALLSAGAAVPGAVMARVAVDGLRDPTSHNLWPFELVIALGVGMLASGGGALAGSLLALVSRGAARR